jgi:rRNA maturation endonuclease Nob1
MAEEKEIDVMFDSLSKSIRGQAQRCNACGQVSQMKDTNVCKKCWPNIFGSLSKKKAKTSRS